MSLIKKARELVDKHRPRRDPNDFLHDLPRLPNAEVLGDEGCVAADLVRGPDAVGSWAFLHVLQDGLDVCIVQAGSSAPRRSTRRATSAPPRSTAP